MLEKSEKVCRLYLHSLNVNERISISGGGYSSGRMLPFALLKYSLLRTKCVLMLVFQTS